MTRDSADNPARCALVCVLALALGALASCTTPGTGIEAGSGPAPRQQDFVVQADVALERGDVEEALAMLALAIERNPTLTVAHIRMGEIYESSGDLESAESSYRTAAQVEPRNFDAQYRHGFVLHQLARLGEAVRAYLRALSVRPNDFEANLNVSIAYLELGEPSLAEPFASEAVRLDPASGPARANLGNVLTELGRDNEAVLQYEAGAELMDLGSDLLMNLAQSLGRLGRYREMENTLDRAIELGGGAPAWERLGYAQFKQGDLRRAASSFQQAIDLDRNHYPAINGLAVCYLNEYHASEFADEQARTQAVTLLRRSLQVRPGQSRIVDLLGRYGG